MSHRGEWKQFCSPHPFITRHVSRCAPYKEASRQFSSALKFNHVFRRLYAKGNSCANRYLVVYCRRNGTQKNRVGLTVGAKLGHAVERNRLRRRLREIYRLHEGQFSRGYDIVVVARAAAIQAPYRQLEGAYLRLAEKLSIYAREAQTETKDT